jgi:hypothetical protein
MLYVVGFAGVLGMICVAILVFKEMYEINEKSKKLDEDKK